MNFRIIPLEVIEYVKLCAIQALSDSVVNIRSTAGTIITTICTTYGFESWPDLLKQLVALLDNPNILIIEVYSNYIINKYIYNEEDNFFYLFIFVNTFKYNVYKFILNIYYFTFFIIFVSIFIVF